jgi:hypothetical protein
MVKAIMIILTVNSQGVPVQVPSAYRDTMEHCRAVVNDGLIRSQITALVKQTKPDAYATFINCQEDKQP